MLGANRAGVAARDRVQLRLPLLGDRISAFLLAGSTRSGLAHDSVARLRRLYYNSPALPFPGQFPALLILVAPASCCTE